MDAPSGIPGSILVPTARHALHTERWPGRQPALGTLIVVHGLGDHLGNHAPMAAELARRLPLDVVGFDFRGHGRSPGRRGVVRRYEDLLDDLAAVVDHLRNASRLFVFGHSMGGPIAALTAIEAPPERFAGLILSNPFLNHATPVPRWKLALGRFLHRVAPGITVASQIDPSLLTRDQASWPARRADPLAHSRISAPLYFGMLHAGAALPARAEALQVPMLLILGAADAVASPEASREFFTRVGSSDKTLIEYPESCHEPYLDLDRDQVIDDTVRWLAARLTPANDLRR